MDEQADWCFVSLVLRTCVCLHFGHENLTVGVLEICYKDFKDGVPMGETRTNF